MQRRPMPVCLTTEQYRTIEKFAREHGMLNTSQAIEKIICDCQ